ncbi:MAG: DUF2169 domain-containing protein, partial [Archangium sp.]|nr:DUF2169 domain-containing protein [Archangium sp.]
MMLVLNDTPFATGGAPLVDKNGLQHWVVMIKATYSLFPDGTTQLAPEQLPTLLVGEPRDPASAASSLRYEADLVLDKPLADVIVNGSAYAPGGAPAAEVA